MDAKTPVEQGSFHHSLRKEALSCLLTTIALVAIGIWVNNVGYGDAFLSPGETEDTFSLVRCVSHIGRVIASLLFVLSPLAVERAEPTLKACIPMLVSCMTAAFLLAYYQSLVPSQVIGCIASFIVGFGYFFIVTCLYLGLAAAVSLKAALAVVGISQVIEQLLSVALSSFCPRTWQIILCIALPLVVMVAFPVIGKPGNTSRNRDSQDVLTPCGQGAHRGPLTPVVRYQLVLLMVASAAINATAMLSDVGTWGYIRSDYRSGNSLAPMIQTVFAGAIVLAATYACLIQTLDKPITHRYQRAFLFLAGIIMVAVTARAFGGMPREGVSALLSAGEYFSHVLMWSIVVDACGSTGVPNYRIAGIGTGVFAALSLGVVTLDWMGVSSFDTPAIMVAYCVILAASLYPDFLFRGALVDNRAASESHTSLHSRIISSEDAPGGDVRDLIAAVGVRCDRLAEQYDLSKRETEVLSLVVQGRSRPSIQSMLVLSEGTVKTHIAHIFRKTGVSSTQELLDLVYDTSA